MNRKTKKSEKTENSYEKEFERKRKNNKNLTKEELKWLFKNFKKID